MKEFVQPPQPFQGQAFSVSLIFFPPDAAKSSDGKHMYLFCFFLCRLCLSVRVQGADTVCFQAVAPPLRYDFKQGPSVSLTLYSNDGEVKTHWI